MSKMIFLSLPVADVERAAAFYEAIGAKRDARFSQPGTVASMVMSETIVLMLSSHDQFANLSPKPIADPRKTAQVLISLSEDSRAAVDATVEKAIGAGGRADLGGKHEQGDFMYGRDFEDLDGHGFGVMWMDVDAAMKAGGQSPAEAA